VPEERFGWIAKKNGNGPLTFRGKSTKHCNRNYSADFKMLSRRILREQRHEVRRVAPFPEELHEYVTVSPLHWR
jgi:hypothetical protein